jgi:carbamoyltransferase
MYILGISCYFHDAAAALIKDGHLIAASHEERFSRKKHDSDFPRLAIEFCLTQAGISIKEVDAVVFYEKPFLKFERIMLSVLQGYPHTYHLLSQMMMQWAKKKLWIRHNITTELGISPQKVLFSKHHFSHAASAFFPSPFTDAVVITVDGVGEKATTAISIGHNNTLKTLKEIEFPHSLGLLYSAFTAWLGFEVNEGEYKVMGMAPYGSPKYVDKVKKLIHQRPDGSFTLDLSYFRFHTSPTHSFTPKLVELFGKPRRPDTHFFTPTSGYPAYFGNQPSTGN